MEKLQLQSLEQEHRKLTAQLKDEREKNKHIVMMLVRECKQLATRVVEESQRFDELQARLDEENRASGRLQEELTGERQRSQQMEAKMEKQLSEFDTEREQLRARLGREEAESLSLRQQVEQLRTDQGDGKDGAAAATAPPKPKALTSVSVATEPVSSRTASCQTDPPPTEAEGPKKNPLTIPVKPTPANYVGLSLPKTTGRGIVHSNSGGVAQTENGSEGQVPHGLPSGVSPRVQAARYKFQEQDQNGTASQSPPARDLSPTNRDNFAAKQQARHTVTQVLSRFTSPTAAGAGPLRPGLPHSASEGGPFPGRLSHPFGLKSPTVAKIDRGNPPPIPPKKPGLSQTPSPPHPPIKVVGDSSRTPTAGLKPATPQLPPKPALDLVPALTASQVGSCSSCPSPGPGRVPQPAAACAECPPIISSPSSINPSSTSSSISVPSSRSSRCSAGSPLATASGKRAPPYVLHRFPLLPLSLPLHFCNCRNETQSKRPRETCRSFLSSFALTLVRPLPGKSSFPVLFISFALTGQQWEHVANMFPAVLLRQSRLLCQCELRQSRLILFLSTPVLSEADARGSSPSLHRPPIACHYHSFTSWLPSATYSAHFLSTFDYSPAYMLHQNHTEVHDGECYCIC